MTLLNYSNLHNFVWFQTIWFIAILGGSHTIWLTIIAATILVHFVLVEHKTKELKIIVACTLVGVIVDSLLTFFHVFEFKQHGFFLPIPIWLVAIWIAFSGTLAHSLEYLIKKPYLMTFLAALCAPISYLAAARFDVVHFPLGNTYTYLIVSAAWIITIPILVHIKRRFD